MLGRARGTQPSPTRLQRARSGPKWSRPPLRLCAPARVNTTSPCDCEFALRRAKPHLPHAPTSEVPDPRQRALALHGPGARAPRAWVWLAVGGPPPAQRGGSAAAGSTRQTLRSRRLGAICHRPPPPALRFRPAAAVSRAPLSLSTKTSGLHAAAGRPLPHDSAHVLARMRAASS